MHSSASPLAYDPVAQEAAAASDPAATREQQLKAWLISIDPTPCQLSQVAGDASFRRYFRARWPDRQAIVMDAPPDKESCASFVDLCRQWRAVGVAVPALLAEDQTQGFLLLEDFGDQQLMQQVMTQPSAQSQAYYQAALRQLVHLQTATSATKLPHYSAALLEQEMHLFDHWFLDTWLGIDTRPAGWTDWKQQLIDQALAQPQVTVHRDYHSRNLMCLDHPTPTLGLLDFQDAVCGPITYDLVSLLKDAYLDWPEAQQVQWLADFQQQHPQLQQQDPAQFVQWYDWMGMQRHLKVAGIFVRLALRDGKSAYLQDLPLTFQHLLQALKKYPQLAVIEQWFREQLAPRLSAKLNRLTQ